MANEFIHLHLHTAEGSFLDGATGLKEVVDVCQREGMRYVAVTEHGSLHSMLSFEKTMRAADIIPLSGQEFYLTLDNGTEEKKRRDNFHLTVLAQNATGYANLKKLSSLAFLTNSHYAPRTTLPLLEEYSEGLFVLSGCISSYINQAIIAATWNKPNEGKDSGDRQRENTNIKYGDIASARAVFQKFVEMFPDSFAVEIMNHGFALEKHVLQYLLPWADEFDIPIVATNDVHYAQEKDYQIQNTLLAITTGGGVDGSNAGLTGVPGAWMKSADEMAHTFKDILSIDSPRYQKILSNSLMIAERCDFVRPVVEQVLPHFPIPTGLTTEKYLYNQVRDGIYAKYPDSRGNREHPAWIRARYEYDIIVSKGFADYFLVVQDFISWARKQGIFVGPGRGSAAGSILAYVLDITTVDPLQYGLLFERFLNPERTAMPDIDVDFQDDRRDEIVKYVAEKYGHDYVAHIATFGAFGPKQALRDVARIKGIPYGESQAFSNIFPNTVKSISEEDIETNPAVKNAIQRTPELADVFHTAISLQGKKRQAGTHASAIIISQKKLIDYVALMAQKGKNGDGLVQIQGDMHDAEDLGLLKMDFLGLRTLTVIAEAQKRIRESGNKDFSIDSIPLDDEDVYNTMGEGKLFGVFQLGEAASARVTTLIKPRNIEEIAIANAMSRPGPVDSLEEYLKRKRGESEYTLLHPDLKPVLDETFGFAIFQEQVMKIAQVLAGYSLAEADGLRKAMGKKLPAEMAGHRERFVNGCVLKGIDETAATTLFEDLAKFSGYGFNKPHSICYSKIAYWTAWLSYHYPAIFLASLLTSEWNDREKVSAIIAEIRRRKITLLPPDVNVSQEYCTVEDEAIRMGLMLVKGIGYDVAKRISRGAPYLNLSDFMQRATANIAGVHSLIGSGACDSLEMMGSRDRALMMEYSDILVKEIQKFRQKQRGSYYREGQTSLFTMEPVVFEAPDYPKDIPYWTKSQTLMAEMEAVGSYLSPSPLLWLAENDLRYHGLAEYINKEESSINKNDPAFSFVLEIREMSRVLKTKKDNRAMRILTVGDAQGITMSMTIFADLYEQVGEKLTVGAFVYGYARVNAYQGNVQLVASQIDVLSLGAVESLQNNHHIASVFDKKAVHIYPTYANASNIQSSEKFIIGMATKKSLLGDVPVYLYSSPTEYKKMACGTSSAHALVKALKTAFPYIGIGAAPARWEDGRWHFAEEEKEKQHQEMPKRTVARVRPQWTATVQKEVAQTR